MVVVREGANGRFVKEIIVENFMSHVYSRVPLERGVNIIVGPNGSGKSSILLALSVALGQTYTERSRALRDLIRRGERIARVTVVLNNEEVSGKRPLPRFRSDEVFLTRYIKDDGNYWYEVNGRNVTKAEVTALLSRLGINPDNMLIIMHQGMVERFGYLSPKDKLKMFEEALGLGRYRDLVLRAKERLKSVLDEEKDVRNALERARETLRYWKEKYERLLLKRELKRRKEALIREYAWARYFKKKRRMDELEGQVLDLDASISQLSRKLSEISAKIGGVRSDIKRLIERMGEEESREVLIRLRDLLVEKYELLVELSSKEAADRVHLSLHDRRKREMEEELRRVRAETKRLLHEAEKIGARVETERDAGDVLDDIRMVNAQLASMSDVSEEVEGMYMRYTEVFRELEDKAKIAEENRKKALEEIKERERMWREKVIEILSEVNQVFGEILSSLGASGYVRLVNSEDMEEAGLEILVGFRGREPVILDAYTQSGGERTLATVTFLLAMQNRVKSPIRAVDEFDVHTDPVNRRELLKHIIRMGERCGGQYIVITPGVIGQLEGDFNIIVVQNVSGRSIARAVASSNV